jgi:hypothetical protein
MATTTVTGRQVARAAPGKFISVSVSTQPSGGKFSVHDCVDPGQASALNCIYPQNFALPDGITVKNGVCVMTVDGTGSFSVTHSS